MPEQLKKLLDGNKAWIQDAKKNSPDLFSEMAAGQKPPFLWIGCADSRVPAEVVTNSLPGSIFVQRNVANMVVHTDYSLLSVVNYAVKALGVEHIIICGHYGCGGVKAAMGNTSLGLLDNWVAHIKDVYAQNQDEIDGAGDADARWKKFVEVNVRQQVTNMARLSFIQEEWKDGSGPSIHGLVFNIENGELVDLDLSVNSAEGLKSVFQFE